MIKIKRLDHIQICIPLESENKARDFYTKIIGLQEIEKPAALINNGGLWLLAGDIQLHIGTENQVINSKRHPAFEVEDLLMAGLHLQNNGLTINEEIQLKGLSRFSFFDPFGNRIEFLQKNAQ